MSTQENDIWRENVREDFYTYLQDKDWHLCEKIISDLKENNYIDEALNLEAELDEAIELDKAWNKGSEDGMDRLQDK